MTQFATAESIIHSAGSTASHVLPHGVAATYPVPIREAGRLALLIMYYRSVSRADLPRNIRPPHYAMYLDESGKVLRFFACTPDELGIREPKAAVRGVGDDYVGLHGWEDLVRLRERFLAISPSVWKEFSESGSAPPAGTTAPLAREYYSLFARLVQRDEAPFYLQAAREFFAWLSAALSTPDAR